MKCSFCGGAVTADQRKCPQCGAANEYYVEHHAGIAYAPKTMEEMRQYCAERRIPLLRMGFCIGRDNPNPRIFGIFEKEGVYTVYGNGPDGTRYVQYRGANEAEGVEKLFGKLLSECHLMGLYPENGKL